MRLLLCHPGASYSTHDVWAGYRDALAAQGHELVHYALDGRISHAGAFLASAYRQARKATPGIEKPSAADVLYLAGQGVLERALRHNVTGVVAVSGMYLHPDALILLRRAGVRTALLLTESPYDDEAQARVAGLADVVFTNERTSVETLRACNPRTHYLPHAYDPKVHTPTLPPPPSEGEAGTGDAPSHDVVFVGSAFAERVELLSAVDWEGLDLGLYGEWSALGSRSRLRRSVRSGPIDNATAAALYRRAKIGLNLYRRSVGFGRRAPRIDHAESLNPRAYELAACGAFHLSDHRAEVEETFGTLVPTFTDARSLSALARDYLHPESAAARRQMAARLPACVAGHTYAARAETLVSHLAAAWRLGDAPQYAAADLAAGG